MSVARINMSHGIREDQRETIGVVKKVRQRLELPVALMLDTRGPEIRLGDFPAGSISLEKGNRYLLSAENVPGDETRAPVTFAGLIASSPPGTCRSDQRRQRGTAGAGHYGFRSGMRGRARGKIGSRKGVNVPGKHLEMTFLSEADKNDLLFGISNE
jgi:pyruvate kinase